MREADPVHNVELRRDRHGHESVVFSFPYVREAVDAVRAIPGRRFDWDSKEWWALQADGTAPYVKGVIERHAWLKVASRRGDVARGGRHRLGRAGRRRQEPGRRELRARHDLRRAARRARAARRDAAGGCGCRSAPRWPMRSSELRGARFDERGMRCAQRLRVGLEPAPATLSLIESVGEPRLKLDVNWDPETIPPSSPCRPARRTGARCRSTRTCSSRSSTTCARSASRSAPNAADVLERLRAEHDARSSTCAARAPTTGRRWRSRPCSAASCARSSAPGSPTR